jgi:hypothetical protein
MLHDHSVVPAEAEVRVSVVAEHVTPTTDVRGRLMGPRCPFAATVEVAYPLRPLPAGGGNNLTRRVVIPEASLWEPESPFLYEGPVELWQDGQRCDRVTVRHGLRALSLGQRGLRVNGRPLTLRGRQVTPASDEHALALRREGCNLLITAVEEGATDCWERADRLGFFVLGRVATLGESIRKHLAVLSRHPSCFGWLIGEADLSVLNELLADAGAVGPASRAGPTAPVAGTVGAARLAAPTGGLVGVELNALPTTPLPEGVHFIVCPPDQAVIFSEIGLPLFVRAAEASGQPTPGLFGWVG